MADRDANTAYWPANGPWAGRSPTRSTPSQVHRSPDAEDWEQVIKEVDAVQDFVSDVIGEALLTVENVNASEEDILPGTPVVITDAAEGDIAVNDGTVAAAAVTGIALETIVAEVADPASPAGSGQIQTDGIVDLTTAEWDAVTGGSGGLTPGAYYFVGDGGAGTQLVTTEPTGGAIIAPVGQALTATKLILRISYPVASSA